MWALPTFAEVADEFKANRDAILRSDKSVARLKRILGEQGYAAMLRPKLVNLRCAAAPMSHL